MNAAGKYSLKRHVLMLAGILLIGMCVAFYRMSGFGVDPFSCMNLGISGYLGMLFGNWQLIMNAVLLIIVWFTVRRFIGLGTIVNMIFVGYTADFLCWLFLDQMGILVNNYYKVYRRENLFSPGKGFIGCDSYAGWDCILRNGT